MAALSDEKRWRNGLKLIGREAVMAQLNRYPGLPDDPVSDLPVQPPYPSRAFCRQWCAEADAAVVGSHANLIVAFVIMATMLASYAACSLSTLLSQKTAPAMAQQGAPVTAPQMRRGMAQPTASGGNSPTGPSGSQTQTQRQTWEQMEIQNSSGNNTRP
jgi:hypothetical protein